MIPPAEVEIDIALVSCLLRQQHPGLADLPIQFLQSGWDNCLFRLGDELVVRMPRRKLGAELNLREQRYLPAIASRLSLPVSVVQCQGIPGCGYPWNWSVCAWVQGDTADQALPQASAAKQWSEFLRSLHKESSDGGPHNPYRGVPLGTRKEAFEERFQRLCDNKLVAFDPINTVWQQGLDADPGFTPVWLHGDLHPMNILCAEGRFTGVIDWGDICVGDAATDLASYYMLFPSDIAEHSLQFEYGATRSEIARAKASAVFFAVVLLDAGNEKSPTDEHTQLISIAKNTLVNIGLM